MNTKQVKYVLTLAREGTFSKAAEILNITQPSLSQYIKKIEKEIGLELFDRLNGDIRLTDAGRIYIDTGRKILDLEHQMENRFTDLASHKRGTLIIGAAPYRAASMLPAIARSYQKIHPGMHLIVREGTTAELMESMEHGEYDLALTLLPVNERVFRWEKVAEEELILAVPNDFQVFPTQKIKDRKYPAVSSKVLNGCKMVMLTEGQFMQNQLQQLLDNSQVEVSTASVVKSLEAQIEMVKAGVGMALMPSGIERFCDDSSVSFYSFIDSLPKREVVVMWRKDSELSVVANELKNVICQIPW